MKPKSYSQKLLIILGVIIGILIIFPIYVMVVSSFKPLNEVYNLKLIPNFSTITLDNYIKIFKNSGFGRYILNSFIISASVTIVALIFHSMAGYSLARLSFPGKKAIFVWMLSTMMVPFAVIMIPLFIIVKAMGMVNSLWGIIIPSIPNAYGIFLFKQFYLGIPKELEESAKIDGSSFFGIYFRIFLPLSKAISMMLAVAFFLANWNNYLWPLIVAQKKSIWVIQIAIASFVQDHATAWNLILAASCVAAIPTVLLFLLFQRYLVDGIKMSGLKA